MLEPGDVVRRLDARFDNLLWMKNSEIARYWAANELTGIERADNQIKLTAPFACPAFTLQVPMPADRAPQLLSNGAVKELTRVESALSLAPGTYHLNNAEAAVCFDLSKGLTMFNI